MDFQLEDTLNILSRTPPALNALLRGAPDDWTMQAASADAWSAWAVVGHLLHGEENDWIARARMILEYGPARPFEPFDREAMFHKYTCVPLPDLLDRFAAARRANLDTLRAMSLTPGKLAAKGLHPSLGEVTLSQLLATWVAHDMNHLGQIAETMSRHYKQAVGPWVEFLPILTRQA